MDIQKVGWSICVYLAQVRERQWALMKAVIISRVSKCGEFLECMRTS
jgi:hypothetical protein